MLDSSQFPTFVAFPKTRQKEMVQVVNGFQIFIIERSLPFFAADRKLTVK